MVCSLSSLPKRCAVVYRGCNDLWLHGCLASFVVFLNQQIAAVRAGDSGDTGEAGPARLLAASHQLQSPGPALGNIQHLITQSLHGASRDEDITLLRRTGVNAGSPQSAYSGHWTCYLLTEMFSMVRYRAAGAALSRECDVSRNWVTWHVSRTRGGHTAASKWWLIVQQSVYWCNLRCRDMQQSGHGYGPPRKCPQMLSHTC